MKTLQSAVLFIFIIGTTQLHAQSWNLTGNTGTNSANHFIGTTDAVNFKIRTNNTIRVNVTSNGKVGIGNFSPVFKLDVKGGSINTDSLYRIKGAQALSSSAAGIIQIGASDSKVGIGTSNPVNRLQVEGDSASIAPVLYVKANNPSLTLVRAIEAYSITNLGQGTGIYGKGGLCGISGESEGGGYTGSTYGIYGRSTGTGGLGTRIGVYGNAYGGAVNWAGYFDGNAYFNGNIGIGADHPQARIHIKHNSTIASTHLFLQESDTNDYARISFQNFSGFSFWNLAAYNSTVNANERMNFYNSTTGNVMSLTGDGKVGIGTSNPSQKITVFNGTSTGTYTTTGWMHTSDERLKTNIKPLQGTLDKILQLEGVSYNWKTNPTDNNQIGFIAQQVEKIFPEVIVKDAEGNYAMAPQNLTAPIIEAIKEQQQQISELKNVVKKLEDALSQCCTNYEQKTISTNNPTPGAARLEQNVPNPFSESTTIKFYIPQNAAGALISIYSYDGLEIKSIPVAGKGFGQVEISGRTLSAGVYSYVLILDGKVMDTKQMILSK